MRFGSL